MRSTLCLVVFASLLLCGCSLDNGLGRTPQMAWNSWNAFACNINETLIMNTAKALVSSGLASVGYNYVNMDDCWASSRNSSGYIIADSSRFPSGIKYLADFVHSLGLKFGLYSDAGTKTCGGKPGSLGYETQDAQQYAAWGVDYLKYDNCYSENLPDEPRYVTMRDALNKTGRPIFFSLCDWVSTTAVWGPKVGNSWRTTADIYQLWDSWTHNLDQTNPLAMYSGPGGWNDPDMLEVGNGLSAAENVAHFSLWALTKSPLILGNDLQSMTNDVLAILKNTEVIAVSQDKLGKQGFRIVHDISTNPALVSNILYADDCKGVSSQAWSYNPANGTITSKHVPGYCIGEYVREWGCAQDVALGDPIYLQPCGVLCGGGRQMWKLENGLLKSSFSNTAYQLCVEIITGTEHEIQLAWNCTNGDNQKWTQQADGSIKNVNGKCLTVGGGQEVWAGPLSDGSLAVVLFNRAAAAQKVTVEWSNLGITGAYTVRDLWAQQNVGTFTDGYSAVVNSHGAVMIKVSKANI